MEILEIMSKPAVTCHANDSLEAAARLMWENDCGALPVLNDEGRVTGMITDRDICMAAYTQGKPLEAIALSSAMATTVHTSRPNEAIENAERLMQRMQIRRIPIVDSEKRPVGLLSLNDIARHAASSRKRNGMERAVTETLAAVCQPRSEIAVARDRRRAAAAE